MRVFVAGLLFVVVGCGSNGAPDAGSLADAGRAPCRALDGELLRRAPSARSLREISGIASNPGDYPIGDSQWARFRRQGYLTAATDLGGVMIRRDFRWAEIERIQGQFNFAAYDETVDEAVAAGVRILGLLAYGNTWATSAPGADEFYPPDDPADFARFAAATADHFRGRVIAWEIWNEPNAGFRFWKGVDLSGDPYAYADLLAATYEAIRAVDPDTPVLVGGTVFTPQFIEGGISWLEGAWEHRPDLGAFFDVEAIHTYQSYPPTAPPELGMGNGVAEDLPLADKIAAHACLLDEHGVAGRPIWITELGWPNFQSVDEEVQARFMVRATLIAAKAGADGVFWYTLRDGPTPASYPPQDAFGLLRNDIDEAAERESTPKPVYHALKAMLTVAGGHHATISDPPLDDMPADGYAVVLEATAAPAVVAAWTVAGEAMVRWRNGAATVIGSDGQELGEVSTGGEVVIGEDVTYLRLH